ncbi:MAG TPA: zinc-ribbon domain-containing protein [Xanthobacteraceae bacterium]
MLIVCANCSTSYQVDASLLGAAGRSVRCVRCRRMWFAHDPAELAAIAQAHRRDVSALTGGLATADPGASVAIFAIEDSQASPAAGDPGGIGDLPLHPPLPVEPAGDRGEKEMPSAEAAPSGALPEPQPQEAIAMVAAPALAPLQPSVRLSASLPAAEDIETVAARRGPGAGPWWSLPALPLILLALLALDTALVAWRTEVVRAAPQTAPLYAAIGLPVNLRGLSFLDVRTGSDSSDGIPVLVVDGTIASASRQAVGVPRLRFSVRNAGGQEVYVWTALPDRSNLAPGERLDFHSRLVSPPPDSRDVLVRFLDRRDIVAGAQ